MSERMLIEAAKAFGTIVMAGVAVYRVATREKENDDDGNSGGGSGPKEPAFLPVGEFAKRRLRR